MGKEVLRRVAPKARKTHRCDFCDGTIQKGEVYDRVAVKDEGTVYDWKSHQKCSEISNFIWNWADIDDRGMTSDEFQDSCRVFCKEFICPSCDHYDEEDEECNQDRVYCLDKIYEVAKTHKLVKGKDGIFAKWMLRKRAEVKNEEI